MTPSMIALVGFAGWTVTLLLGIGGLRTFVAVSGRKAANTFRPDGADVSPFSNRLCRAHANCYENLPIFAALVLAAALTGNGAATDSQAYVFLGARLAQSVTHLISTSVVAVQLRFAFFLVQVAIYIWWVYRLLAIGLG